MGGQGIVARTVARDITKAPSSQYMKVWPWAPSPSVIADWADEIHSWSRPPRSQHINSTHPEAICVLGCDSNGDDYGLAPIVKELPLAAFQGSASHHSSCGGLS